MGQYGTKLVLLRGNSGSGKSSIAEQLRLQMSGKTALIGQDNLRRTILKEKEVDGGDNIDLIEQTVRFALDRDYNVVLEGIFYFPRYGHMLQRLVDSYPKHFVYYFDASLEETLRRHATKPNSHEFGEEQMRSWYSPHDTTGFTGEKIIPESSSFENTLSMILADVEG